MARNFVYDGREFSDPDPKLSVDEVRKQLAEFFPELANADAREERRGEDTVVTFTKRIGTKRRPHGRPARPRDVVAVLRRVPARRLRIFELAQELLGADGELDLDRAAEHQPDINLAVAETRAYARATAQAAEALRQRRAPIAPLSLVDFLERRGAYIAFREVVREVFPDAEAAILAATSANGDRESARVWAFLQRVKAEFFPVYDYDEYDRVLCGIPFVRNAWSYDRFHDLDLPAGELLLFTLCAQPYLSDDDSRLSLLDAAEAHVPHALLADIPAGGLTPAELHERLDGTPYAAAAEYAEWLWGDTGSIFLDADEEMVVDIEWTRENVLDLAADWDLASGILDRTGELARWLEADPAPRFARVLDAALGRDAHLEYERMRRFYACEITEQGLVAVPHDHPNEDASVALSLDVAA